MGGHRFLKLLYENLDALLVVTTGAERWLTVSEQDVGASLATVVLLPDLNPIRFHTDFWLWGIAWSGSCEHGGLVFTKPYQAYKNGIQE